MKTRMIKWIVVLFVCGFLAASIAVASEQSESITGTVAKTDQGIVITVDDGDTYVVQGKDLSSLVGQSVTATGMLSEDDAGKTIKVISVEPTQE
ncbi:MAG: hypothetical protein HKP58_12590 [Desulfatitalea sp.]|nr:hypothetical protein [Desulfatitalea sp.]NNK01239.1 hypothetical protein [Desulfatitalea sp.]